MKQVVLNLSNPQYAAGPVDNHHKLITQSKPHPHPHPHPAAAAAAAGSVMVERAERDEAVYKPQPTEFVRSSSYFTLYQLGAILDKSIW